MTAARSAAKAIVEGCVAGADDAPKDTSDGNRWHRGEFECERACGGLQVFHRMYFVHETDPVGFSAVDLLGAQDHVERLIPTDAARQTGRASPRRHGPEVQLRQPDPSALIGGETEVAREG